MSRTTETTTWETDEIDRWVANDEALYHAVRAIADDADSIETLVINYLSESDCFDRFDWDEVDWNEVIEVATS